MKRGDWFFIFLSIAVVLVAALGTITSYQNHKPNPNIKVIEPERTQSVTGPALVILGNPPHAQGAIQVAPKHTTQR